MTDTTQAAGLPELPRLPEPVIETQGPELPVRWWLVRVPGGTRLYTEDQTRAYARAALAAQAVPEGWRMVPVEPTPEMRKAAADAWLDCDSKLILNKASAALRAGIAASKELHND